MLATCTWTPPDGAMLSFTVYVALAPSVSGSAMLRLGTIAGATSGTHSV